MTTNVSCTWPGCGSTFTRPYSLRRHVEETHRTLNRVTCEECPQTFSRLEFLKRHVHSHHGNGKEICDICFCPYRADYLAVHRSVCIEKTKPQCAIPVDSEQTASAREPVMAATEGDLTCASQSQGHPSSSSHTEHAPVLQQFPYEQRQSPLGHESSSFPDLAWMQAETSKLSPGNVGEISPQESTSWLFNGPNDDWSTHWLPNLDQYPLESHRTTAETFQSELPRVRSWEDFAGGLESIQASQRPLRRSPSSTSLDSLGSGHLSEASSSSIHDGWIRSLTYNRLLPVDSGLGQAHISTIQSRKWRCHACNKEFSRAFMLDSHAKDLRHRAFTCEDCGRGYVRQSTLARHRASAHGSRPDHVCTLCALHKSFRRRDHLLQHQREVHRRFDVHGL